MQDLDYCTFNNKNGWLLFCLSVYLSVCLCLSVYVSILLSVCLSTHVCLSVYPSICLSICIYVHLSIYLSICLSIYLSACLSVYLSIYLSIYVHLSVCIYVHLSIYLSIYLSIVCLSIYLSVCLYLSTCIYFIRETQLTRSFSSSATCSLGLFSLTLVFIRETKHVTSVLPPHFSSPLPTLPPSLSPWPDLMVSSRHCLLISSNSQINEQRMRAMLEGAEPSPGSLGSHQF